MKTKKGQKEKLRLKILETALGHFKTYGRSGAATESILEKAGLTKGALYSHFESKDDLFVQAVCDDLTKLSANIHQLIESDGPEALKNMITAHLSERTLDNIAESCVLSSLSSDMNRCGPADRKKFADKMETLYHQFAEALKFHFPESSQAKRLDMAYALYASLVGTISLARNQVDRKSALQILKANQRILLETYASGN